MINDTIGAISSAKGKGGVAIIRISGQEALDIVGRIFVLPNGKRLENPEGRKCYYGKILRDGKEIDDVVLTFFKGPASYTGEDVCEISCHGGLYITQAVLETVLGAGARMALPGEFTRRAYINGKLSLSRAEAVGQAIDATNDAQLRLSVNARGSALSQALDIIRAEMLDLLARAYVIVDYPDEELPVLEREQMTDSVESILLKLSTLKRTYRASRAVIEGVKTAIVGRPNAGKSSLYNAISGEDLAIVTDIAGTTRDVIEHTVSVGDVTLRLSDTAGIRETQDAVEKIGVERARARLDESELVLAVFDGSVHENSEDYEILDSVSLKSAIAIINKSDSERKMSLEFEEKIKNTVPRVVYMSAKSGDGLDSLAKELSEMYALDEIDISNDAVITNARQASALSVALERVGEASERLKIGESPDIICFSLEEALASLNEIDARGVSEEIVNTIFSHFCVGK